MFNNNYFMSYKIITLQLYMLLNMYLHVVECIDALFIYVLDYASTIDLAHYVSMYFTLYMSFNLT